MAYLREETFFNPHFWLKLAFKNPFVYKGFLKIVDIVHGLVYTLVYKVSPACRRYDLLHAMQLASASKRIAEDLDILPEQVTLQFIGAIRKLMENDPDFPPDGNDLALPEPERQRWNAKCRVMAQQVLQQSVNAA